MRLRIEERQELTFDRFNMFNVRTKIRAGELFEETLIFAIPKKKKKTQG